MRVVPKGLEVGIVLCPQAFVNPAGVLTSIGPFG